MSQIWVAPFVQTLWDQSADVSGHYACYNYYTPPDVAGNVNNYPCGCVATCMAQLMYYFQYPITGVGTATFSITNNGATEMTSLLGGNGSGGPYVWSSMPLSPNQPTSAQAIAIGALTHDAGATVHMDYAVRRFLCLYFSRPASPDQHLPVYQCRLLRKRLQRHQRHKFAEHDQSQPGRPVARGAGHQRGNGGGHCVLVDGYGYSASTLFHHVNAGWGGDDDIWYALPGIDTPDNGDYTIVQACIYNIYTNGSGQIISGRVTDPTGAPVAGATVTAARTGGGTLSATTDTNGIYALANIPAASTYTLTVTKTGDSSATNNYSTGTSVYNCFPAATSGARISFCHRRCSSSPETGFAAIGPTSGPSMCSPKPTH